MTPQRVRRVRRVRRIPNFEVPSAHFETDEPPIDQSTYWYMLVQNRRDSVAIARRVYRNSETGELTEYTYKTHFKRRGARRSLCGQFLSTHIRAVRKGQTPTCKSCLAIRRREDAKAQRAQ